MSNAMTFPDTVDEFMEQYKMTDTECVYSNGIEYVPIFRMEQWFKHLEEKPKTKYVEREAVLNILASKNAPWDGYQKVSELPAADVQPVKNGKWILHNGGAPWCVIECSECGEKWHHWQGYAMPNYCSNCGADMRGEP